MTVLRYYRTDPDKPDVVAYLDGATVYKCPAMDDWVRFTVVDNGGSSANFRLSHADYESFQLGVTGAFDLECHKALKRIDAEL